MASDQANTDAIRLIGLMRSDRDIATIVNACLAERGLASLQQLADDHPDVLAELVSVVDDLNEQAPPTHIPGVSP